VTAENKGHRSLAATGQLAVFADAGVLTWSDCQLARHLVYLYGGDDELVTLAIGLVLAANRAGSVCLDLTAADALLVLSDQTADADGDDLTPADLPWPEPTAWLECLRHSPLVRTDTDPVTDRPLRLIGRRLYLERFWADQEAVAQAIQRRLAVTDLTSPSPLAPCHGSPSSGRDKKGTLTNTSASPVLSTGNSEPSVLPTVSLEPLVSSTTDTTNQSTTTPNSSAPSNHPSCSRATATDQNSPQPNPGRPGEPDQRSAIVDLVRDHRFAVIAGGPGTGKTTSVAQLLAAVAGPKCPPRIVLTAPTGKAAARLDQAVRAQLAGLGLADLAATIAPATTLHRTLGLKPDGTASYHHDQLLPADLVIVDEVSMLSLHHMRQLLEAVPPAAHLVLVGDPDQLASVESGAVLADLMACAEDIPHVQLTNNYRFSGALAELAAAIRAGDADQTLDRLLTPDPALDFEPSADGAPSRALISHLRHDIIDQSQAIRTTLTASTAPSAAAVTAALTAVNQHRLLCAHRRGRFGVAHWHYRVSAWLAEAFPGQTETGWPLGLPVQVTRNDESLGVFNGDTGVIALVDGRPRVALLTTAGQRLLSPAELEALEPVWATTIHKAQGSQFDTVTVVVPEPGAALLTRELLYTAVTRATAKVRLIGSPEAIAAAVQRPALRASGLADRLADSLPNQPH
jgi:exodeoxyribonuclease V alpha subunit